MTVVILKGVRVMIFFFIHIYVLFSYIVTCYTYILYTSIICYTQVSFVIHMYILFLYTMLYIHVHINTNEYTHAK